MLDMHTYTLRYYERVGIIEPGRSRGNVRLYSDRDIAVLKRVKSMVDDMGINLPGVEVILRMMQRVGELQNELNQAQEELERLRGGEEE
jgi:MerR family transcriptional regulator/heat shock protein HspR